MRIPFLSRVRLDLKAVIAVSGLFLFLVVASSATYQWLHRSSSSCAGEFDLAIIGGEIIDGLGGPAFRADLGIRNKRIVCIGSISVPQAAQVIDATGLTVAPGFIDVHTHVERNVPTRAGPFLAPNFVRQGVTSIITGNCGRSFLDLGKAFNQLEANGTEVNIASFVGHNTIRQHVMSDSAAVPSAEQLAKMKGLVAAGMRDGALGLSTGLEYIPGAFAKTDEIAELARVVRAEKGIYVSHIRNEGSDGLAAIAEAISIGQRTGVHVHISHFKAEGPNQWGSATARLNLVKAAKDKGLIVSLDQYPYTASSTTIAVLLPSWVSSGGTARVKDRLKDSSTHERVRREMLEKLSQAGWSDYSFARVSYCGFNHSVVGLTIPEITQTHALVRPHPNYPRPINISVEATVDTRETNLERQADTVIDLFIHGDAQMVFFNMNEADVETIMLDPDVMFGSDSGVRDESSEALPHPRGLGTFPRVLGLFGRDKHLFPMEEAVRRMTSLPAQTFGLSRRGQIKESYYADLVVFDRDRVIDTATYEHPLNSPQGIYYLLVNGAVVLDHELPTNAQPGMVLRRQS
jgi:N-acyl-D-amino-acid deacylase